MSCSVVCLLSYILSCSFQWDADVEQWTKVCLFPRPLMPTCLYSSPSYILLCLFTDWRCNKQGSRYLSLPGTGAYMYLLNTH